MRSGEPEARKGSAIKRHRVALTDARKVQQAAGKTHVR